MDQETYRTQLRQRISSCLQDYECQPILFVGSGLSRRYLNLPSWHGLLNELANQCPNITHPINYYLQQANGNYPEVGQQLVDAYFKWGWSDLKEDFPPELFEPNADPANFLKHATIRLLQKEAIPDVLSKLPEMLANEVKSLASLSPHAIITTNYDELLENVFPEHEPIIGQRILRMGTEYVGELLKIHGSAADPNTIILTKQDYDYFGRKRQYITAKLLTYFLEHPIFFVGYSLQDVNIRSILSNIYEVLDRPDEVVPNMFFVRWIADSKHHDFGQTEELIDIGDGDRIRVNLIETTGYRWLFDAIADQKPISNVPPKVLRAFMARTYKLVRTDIPKSSIEVKYEHIASAVEKPDALPSLLGLGDLASSAAVNIDFPYTLTDVGKLLGFKGWHGADKLLQKIAATHGVNIKSSDNAFHANIRYGKQEVRKYSELTVSMLKSQKSGKPVKQVLKTNAPELFDQD